MNHLEQLLNYDSEYWFLENIVKVENKLSIRLVEGVLGAERNTEMAHGIFRMTRPVEKSKLSRNVLIEFDDFVSYNVTSESYSPPDPSEIHITKSASIGYHYQIATKAKFLDYFKSECSWFSDVEKRELILYRIVTLHDVCEVLSFYDPIYSIKIL